MGSQIKKLFKDRAASLKLFGMVAKYVKSLGEVSMIVSKTQVAFKTKRQFAWVWLPQMWIKKAPADAIVISFSLDHRVKDRRIKEVLEPYPGRFMHHAVIKKPAQFDAKVKAWLREACAFSEQTKKTE